MSLVDHCPNCEKKLRVPHADRELHCRVCDGVLALSPSALPSVSEDKTCGECGANITADASFCEDCGVSLDGNQAAEEKRTALDEREAGAEMRKALKTIKGLGSFLRVLIGLRILNLAMAGLAVLLTMSSIGEGWVETLVVFVVLGLDLGLLMLVSHQLTRRPFPAALGLAIFATLVAVLRLLGSDLDAKGMLIAGPIIASLPACYWFVTMKAPRLTRLSEEYPDLFLARRMRAEHKERVSRNGSISRRSDKRIKRDSKPPFVMLGVLAVFVACVIIAGLINRPGSPDTALGEIGRAWNTRDFAVIEAYVEEDKRETFVRGLGKIDETYGWATTGRKPVSTSTRSMVIT
ncbi:MAG: hypothetical protein ACI841_000247 [Planctomycetota bacterium]|jgi:hypothetical protein